MRLLTLSLVPLAVLLAVFLLAPQAAPVVIAQPAGWVELVEKRTLTGKSYINLANPAQRSTTVGIGPIHYESTPDSGVYDAEVDFTPRRVNNAQLDGWTVTQNGWHYALGQPGDKSTDGWVGFGGRQGDHWIKFRLSRVGYLYGPTRAWEDLGGPPMYDRAQLSSTTSESEYGHGNMVTVQTTATWANLWNTPGGGSLNITWRASAGGLKEDIIINQAAREWLAANRPPSTPAADTWFGFVLQVDWSDIPKAILDGLEVDLAGDFSVTADNIELRDALNRLLAFMPLSEVRVPTGDPFNPFDVRTLDKRFWLDGDGNHYVLMGIRIPELVGMAAGDLIFDPTVDEQIGASLDDGWSRADGTFQDTAPQTYVGDSAGAIDSWYRFTTVNVPRLSVIDVAYITVTPDLSSSNAAKSNIYLNAIDDAIAPLDQAGHAALTRTTAFTVWDDEPMVIDVPENSPSITSVIAEVTDRAGWSANNALQVLWDDDGSAAAIYYRLWSYDGDSAKALQLHIEYSPVWVNTAPSISNAISSETTTIDVDYTRSFTATDPDTNQTLQWELNTTDAPFTITVWNGGNRTTWVNATPNQVGSFYVNVTVGDGASPTNGTDWVNFTLSVTTRVGAGTTFDSLLPVGLAISGFFIVVGLFALTKPGGRTMGQLLVFIGGLALIFVGFDYQISIGDAPMALMIAVAGLGVMALSSVEMVQSYRR